MEDNEDDYIRMDAATVPSQYPSYYQRSINAILESVQAAHVNILNDEERALLSTVLGLDADPQRLLYRLFLRKAGWFRTRKLAYKDISSLKDAAHTLSSLGLLERTILSMAYSLFFF